MFGLWQGISLKSFLNALTTKQAILIITIFGVVVFFNSLANSFVGDDTAQIVNNRAIHSLSNIFSFFTGSTFYGGEGQAIGVYYKPLLSTSFSFLYTVFGPNAPPFHLFQIFLHITNAFLVFLLLKHFFNKTLSLILSLAFLVHPINSEAVFYISATQEVLFFFFGVSGLLILAKSLSKKAFVYVSLLLFLSLLSKETGGLFLFISLVYSFLFKRKHLYPLLTFTPLLVVLYFILRTNAVGILTKPLNSPIGRVDFFERLLNTPAIVFYYLKTFIFPFNLAYSQHWIHSKITPEGFLLPLVIDLLFLSVVFFFALILHKKGLYKYLKIYIFFSIWFFLGIILHLQIFPLDETVTDRWFYFPIVGVLGMIAAIIEAFNFNVLNKRNLIIALLLIVFFSGRTFVRSFDWRSNLALATHDNKVSQSYVLENIIGFELIKKGRPKEGEEYIKRSVQLYPYITNYNNLGLAYLHLGDYKKAREAYFKGLEYGEYFLLYENLAGLALVYGNARENIKFIENVSLRKFPQNGRIWLFLAILKYSNNDVEGAKEAIVRAYYYSKDENTTFVYNKIMSGQPLQLNFQIDRLDIDKRK